MAVVGEERRVGGVKVCAVMWEAKISVKTSHNSLILFILFTIHLSVYLFHNALFSSLSYLYFFFLSLALDLFFTLFSHSLIVLLLFASLRRLLRFSLFYFRAYCSSILVIFIFCFLYMTY